MLFLANDAPMPTLPPNTAAPAIALMEDVSSDEIVISELPVTVEPLSIKALVESAILFKETEPAMLPRLFLGLPEPLALKVSMVLSFLAVISIPPTVMVELSIEDSLLLFVILALLKEPASPADFAVGEAREADPVKLLILLLFFACIVSECPPFERELLLIFVCERSEMVLIDVSPEIPTP